jgi:glycosyltransferase involved in cell wall biosynthesis
MKILFDHQTFYQVIGGVSRYFSELFTRIEKDDYQIVLSCKFSNNLYLNNHRVRPFFPKMQYGKIVRVMQLINKYFSKKIIKKGEYDVFHATQYSPYFVDFVERPFVITIHDMVSEIFNNNPNNSKNKKIIIPLANKIIAISENTKNDILRFYPEVDPHKISVIHHGYTQKDYDLLPNIYGDYILFIGQRSGYKNFEFFLKAIIPMMQKDTSLQLVCTGTPFDNTEIKIMEDAGIYNKCYCSFVTDSQLFSLYSHAKVFVFPSLYEGFGIPILEAFSNNCPVCMSNASCFPEIGGDAALYFDPRSTSAIQKAVSSIIYDADLTKALRIKGKKRIKLFSWKKSAYLHMKLYKSMCVMD